MQSHLPCTLPLALLNDGMGRINITDQISESIASSAASMALEEARAEVEVKRLKTEMYA